MEQRGLSVGLTWSWALTRLRFLFGLWTWVGPRNHVLDGCPDPHAKWQFSGKRGGPLQSIGTLCGELCKMAELTKMPFGLCTLVDPRKHVFNAGAHWRHLANTIPCMCGGDVAFLSNYFGHLLSVWLMLCFCWCNVGENCRLWRHATIREWWRIETASLCLVWAANHTQSLIFLCWHWASCIYFWFHCVVVGPSVLWRCWLGGRKGIRSVKKTDWWGTGMVICVEWGANDLHMVQLMPLPPRHLLLQ